MGRWFERFFSGAGHKVLISGRKTELTYNDLAEKCDLVCLSTPLDAAINICRQIGPVMNQNQLLIDFCSLKEDICKCMLESTTAQVAGTHPLFGPFTDSVKGQNIILCPGRGTDRLNWLEDEFKTKGALVTRMNPTEHDRNMAVVQGLTHFLSVCMGRTLQKMNMHPDEAIFYSTPIFRVKIDLIGRLFAQDLDLYKNLISKNKYVPEALEVFLSSFDEGKKHLLSGQDGQDEKGTLFMKQIHGFFEDFCQNSLRESNKMLSAIYSQNSGDR